jgi:hypothetical protein
MPGRGWTAFATLAGIGNIRPCENATDRAAGDILQTAVAYSCGVSTLVKGYVGGITSGRQHLEVLVGDIAHHCRTVGVCVSELYLRIKGSGEEGDIN